MTLYPNIKRRTTIRQVLYLIFLILLPIPAQSVPFLELHGSGHSADGFSARYTTRSTSAYFNPAKISLTTNTLDISFIHWIKDHRIVRNPRPEGYDVPAEVFEARVLDDGQLLPLNFRPLPSSEVDFETRIIDDQPQNFLTISTTKVLLNNRIAFGVVTLIPIDSFQEQRPYFVDENAQFFDNRLYFEHLSGKFGNLMVTSGLAVKIFEAFRMGVGLTLETHSSADPKVFVSDAANTERAVTLSEIRVNSAFTPHFGFELSLMDNWQIQGTAHLPYQSSVQGKSKLRFWDQGAEDDPKPPLEFEFVYDYLPMRIGLGSQISWHSSNYEFILAGGVLWQQWSRFIDRVSNSPKDFENTYSPEINLTMRTETHLFQTSMRFSPSSVPQQEGRTNYVDNEQIAASIGYQHRVKQDDHNLVFGIGTTAYYLEPRAHSKKRNANTPIIDELPESVSIRDGNPIEGSQGLQTNNPGFPGFESNGFGIFWGLKVGIEQ